MSDLIASLSTTTPELVEDRIASLSAHWMRTPENARRYWLVDAGMRLAWLAARARTPGQVARVEQLTEAFRRLERLPV